MFRLIDTMSTERVQRLGYSACSEILVSFDGTWAPKHNPPGGGLS